MKSFFRLVGVFTFLALLIFFYLNYTIFFPFEAKNTEKIALQEMKSFQTCVRPCHIFLDNDGQLDVKNQEEVWNSACKALPHKEQKVNDMGMGFACTTVLVAEDECAKTVECKVENNNCVTYLDKKQFERCVKYVKDIKEAKEKLGQILNSNK